MAILNYSFRLTPPAAAARRDHDTSEFRLQLDARWRPVAAEDGNTLNFQSDDDGAALVVSADFFDIADDQARPMAERCLASRIEALETASPGRVRVLRQAIEPHRGGAALELSLAAEVEDAHVHLHLGYVTSRKVLSFSMVCPPGRQAAMALFNATVPGFRPRLP